MTYGPYTVTVVDIHDGDTIYVDVLIAPTSGRVFHGKPDIDLGFNVWRTAHGIEIKRQSVRLLGCNAPELSTDPGKAALAFIQTILTIGEVVKLEDHGWDKYGGRIDGVVTLPNGDDLAKTMIAAGHAVAWDGKGTKPV